MASTSPAELAQELLNRCLSGDSWSGEVLDALAARALDGDERIAAEATRALFSILVERLADLFEPRLADVYAALFARVLERAKPEFKSETLVDRYRAVREVRPVTWTPGDIYVLSRVTLGADVAITSIVLDGARQRFPDARLWLAGPRKAWELFEHSPGLRHLPVAYGRSATLRDRLSVFEPLAKELSRPGSLVLDPDSRLTQLGLLPVCPAERHHLFESRAYGGDSLATLPALARQWVRETLGVENAEPWIHPKYQYDFGAGRVTTISFGVGENPEKRIADPFEEELLRYLSSGDGLVMVDAGAPGSEEEARVHRAVEQSGAASRRTGIHTGSFASFAAMIAASSQYVGYDSAGQHVAAALGIPLVSIFAGYANERMLARWSPASSGPCTVIPAMYQDPQGLLAQVRAAIPL